MIYLVKVIAPIFLIILTIMLIIIYLRSRYYFSLGKRSSDAFQHLIETRGFQRIDLADPEYDRIKNNLIFHTFWGDTYREASARDLCMLLKLDEPTRTLYVEAEAHKSLRISITFRRFVFYRPLVIVPLNLEGIIQDDIMIFRRSIKYHDITGKVLTLANEISNFGRSFLLILRNKEKTTASLDQEIQKILIDQCGRYPLDGKEDIHNLTSPQNVIIGRLGIAISARPTDSQGMQELLDFAIKLSDALKSMKKVEQRA